MRWNDIISNQVKTDIVSEVQKWKVLKNNELFLRRLKTLLLAEHIKLQSSGHDSSRIAYYIFNRAVTGQELEL